MITIPLCERCDRPPVDCPCVTRLSLAARRRLVEDIEARHRDAVAAAHASARRARRAGTSWAGRDAA